MSKDIIFYGILTLLFVSGAGIYIYVTQQTADDKSIDPIIDTSGTSTWAEYVNEEYGFAVKYPPEWDVSAHPQSRITPKFNIYKRGSAGENPPFDHFSEATHVSVFPEGIPTEGVFGEREAFSPQAFREETSQAIQYIFSDGTSWAVYAQFTQAPSSWNSSGFVWAKAARENLETICMREGEEVDEEACNPLFGDRIVHKGDINEADWQMILTILKTFRFLDED